MIDFIFGVDDPVAWHTEYLSFLLIICCFFVLSFHLYRICLYILLSLINHRNMLQNKSHYSFLGLGGPKFVSHVQNEYGAHIYYNTLVPVNNFVCPLSYSSFIFVCFLLSFSLFLLYFFLVVLIAFQKIKYGVISHELLKRDLLHWDTFYVSGRMQKPVCSLPLISLALLLISSPCPFRTAHVLQVLTLQDDSEITMSNKVNLRNAVFASLLLLPETFEEPLLYEKIASLSYLGISSLDIF